MVLTVTFIIVYILKVKSYSFRGGLLCRVVPALNAVQLVYFFFHCKRLDRVSCVREFSILLVFLGGFLLLVFYCWLLISYFASVFRHDFFFTSLRRIYCLGMLYLT